MLVSQHNPAMRDLEQALTNSLSRDGKGGMSGPLVMGGNPIRGIAPGVNPDDAATVGQLTQIPGPEGAADNTYTSLAAFKASEISRKTASLVGVPGVPDGRFNWTNGNYAGQADDLGIIKANSTDLLVGAWVRQSTSGIITRQDAAAAVIRTARDKANDFINALDYGVVANGSTDDRIALQAAVDAASSLGRPLQLPAGVIGLGAALDLRGRSIDMRGVPNRTTIKALAGMAVLINAEEESDTYYTPFNLQDIYVDGSNLVTNANVSVRFRHGYDLTNLWSFNGYRAFRERDCYLSRHWNVRTGVCQIGFHIEGSNHSSSYMACSAIGGEQAGILLEALGAQPDGNHGLLFSGCDVEFGAGYGVVANANTSARFDGCYLGEAIGKAIVYNAGAALEINGGIAFWGQTAQSYLVHAASGQTIFRGTRLAAQDFGSVITLVYATAAEITSQKGAGKARFQDIDGYLPVGGDPVLPGDLLDHGPQRSVFAPRWGRIYGAENGDATVSIDIDAVNTPNTQKVTCSSVTGPNPRIGLFAPLINTHWRTGKPMYLVLVYRSSKPVTARVSIEPLGTALFDLGLAPETSTTKTYIKLDPMPANAANGVLEFFISGAAVGDFFELQEAFFADSTMHKQNTGTLGALYKC